MKIKILLLVSIYLLGCSREISQVVTIDYSNLEKATSVLTLNDVSTDLTYVPLETNSDCALSNILKIQVSTNFIYVLNVNPSGVYCFNAQGKFVSKIGSEGRAPGEYVAPTDIYFHEQTQKLYVADIISGILVYSAKGEYINTIKQSKNSTNLMITADHNLLMNPDNLFGRNKYQLIEQSLAGDTIAVIPNYQKFNAKSAAIYPTHTTFINFANEIVFHPQLSDTVYKYNPVAKNITPKYIFKFKNGITNTIREDFMNNILKVQFVTYIAESDKYLYVSVFDKDWQEKLYIIDKSTAKAYRADFTLGTGFNTQFMPKWQNEHYLIGLFEPASLSYTNFNDITEEARVNAYKFFREKGIEVHEESNPIIMKLKIAD